MKREHLTDELSPPTEQPPELVWEHFFDRLRCERPGESDDDRLRRIRNAIARGQFHVSARGIADRLIERLLKS